MLAKPRKNQLLVAVNSENVLLIATRSAFAHVAISVYMPLRVFSHQFRVNFLSFTTGNKNKEQYSHYDKQ